ncbi:GDYXXLXY domain-containing protein [Nocardioides sp. GXQ0305]|uniref:GDYXXLXY domain-containing protein n=1 Tax=Nocardioides sp. GXQ0305 TaxID=3423912 RepID=UPI003D7E8EFC
MNRVVVVALVAVAQLAFVGAAVAPQLSSRLTGEDYRMEVRPLDPIDPFRGAYVTLDYPGLQAPGGSQPPSRDDGQRGAVYVPLVERDGTWVAAGWRRTRPAEAPYLACDDTDRAIHCGIESYFVPQDRAAELERRLAERGGVATVRIDDRGHATVIDVR